MTGMTDPAGRDGRDLRRIARDVHTLVTLLGVLLIAAGVYGMWVTMSR